ncbi:uncharacterized protein LOC119173506 isoform X2 [Rhipicephalus microplus]|uniref:uncharacterized protein LOC119173506 isoform X2 n=1 Tax=Rhipicephalus microplus TaxID=6941 RepID=UPI003F6D3254
MRYTSDTVNNQQTRRATLGAEKRSKLSHSWLSRMIEPVFQVHPQDRPPGGTDHSQLWAPEDACNHAAWITNLVCTLVRCCNDPVLWALLPLCTMAVDLCELLLPLVVETLADDGTHWNAVVAGMATFLQCHAQLKDDAPQKSQSTGVSEPIQSESRNNSLL